MASGAFRSDDAGRTPWRGVVLVAVVAAALALAAPAAAASSDQPDWPCIQPFVPEIGPATMWAGPPVSEVPDSFRRDESVRTMVDRLADPVTTIEQGEAAIETFAGTLGAHKNEVLTAVFAGLLTRFNEMRAEVLAGIKRFGRRQRALTEKVARISAEMSEVRRKDGAGVEKHLKELEEQRAWALRVFDERQKMTRYLCEKPVELEQKLGALARALMYKLD